MQQFTKPFVDLRKFLPKRPNVARPAVPVANPAVPVAIRPVANPVEQHKQAEAEAKAATTKAMVLEDFAVKHTLEKKKTKLVAEVAQHTQAEAEAKAAHGQLEMQLKSARTKDDSIDHSKLQYAVNTAEENMKDIKDKKNEKETTLKSLQAGAGRRHTRHKRRKSKHRRRKRRTKKHRRKRHTKKHRKRHTKKRRRSRRR